MTKHLLFIVSALALFINADCKKDIVEPPIVDVKPGSRNYTWTVDTVYAPYNSFFDIDGSDSNDLWTVNPGDADKIFYHYDGKKWQSDLIPRNFSPYSLFCLYRNAVWSCGQQGKIWSYNGVEWKEIYTNISSNITLQSICVVAPDNIYAVGQYFDNQNYWGVIIHYNGTQWKQIDIPKIHTAFVKIRYDNTKTNKLYLLGFTDEQDSYQLYEFDGNTLFKIKSGTESNNQMGDILEIGRKLYFIIGYDFYSYSNNNFTKIGRLSDSPEFLNAGVGRSEKDIFLAMSDGIAHYNGENTEYLLKFSSSVRLSGMKIFEKDIFFIGRDQKGNNLIFHGTLND